MYNSFLFFLLGLFLSFGWSCSPTKDSEKLAEVDGTIITRAEIDRTGGKQLQNLRQQLYQLERQKLNEYIGATLLSREAKDRGVSVSTLMEQEVNAKVPPVSAASKPTQMLRELLGIRQRRWPRRSHRLPFPRSRP